MDRVVTRFALHHLPDFWKQVALVRMAAMLRPGGQLFLRDVAFSFPPGDYIRAMPAWIERMPRVSGYAREDFETHVRDEHSTFAWVLHEMAPGLNIRLEVRRAEREYVDLLCFGPDGRTVVEFKYFTRTWVGTDPATGEPFHLRNHEATDLGRQGFVFDIARLERFCEADRASNGFAKDFAPPRVRCSNGSCITAGSSYIAQTPT